MQLNTINDYVEKLLQKFPDLSKSDIKKIISYGWKQYYLANSYGGDVLINDSELWAYTGQLTTNSLIHYKRYKRKLCVKLRVLYKRKKIQWDGFYYFGLTEDLYNKVMALNKKKGRKKKIFDYGTIYAYKIFDECCILESNKNYIFRIPYPLDLGFKIKLDNLKTDKAKLIKTLKVLSFKDILVNNYKYEYL